MRVIIGLPLAPLAAAYGRGFAAFGTTRKLDVSTVASRRYLGRVDAVSEPDDERVDALGRVQVADGRLDVSWTSLGMTDNYIEDNIRSPLTPLRLSPAPGHESGLALQRE